MPFRWCFTLSLMTDLAAPHWTEDSEGGGRREEVQAAITEAATGNKQLHQEDNGLGWCPDPQPAPICTKIPTLGSNPLKGVTNLHDCGGADVLWL